jgi:hypothetical protein
MNSALLVLLSVSIPKSGIITLSSVERSDSVRDTETIRKSAPDVHYWGQPQNTMLLKYKSTSTISGFEKLLLNRITLSPFKALRLLQRSASLDYHDSIRAFYYRRPV